MKKLFAYVIVLAAALAFCCDAAAQAKITTRKYRLADFPTKVTKVVLAGNDMFNNALKEEISRRWLVSPYEYCTLAEYEKIKENNSYYFLIPVDSKLKKEAGTGVMSLALEKGGKRDGEESEQSSIDILTLPCASAEAPSGREYVFLPALVDIIQSFVNEAMISDRVAYGGLGSLSTKPLRDKTLRIVFSEDDIASTVQWNPSWEDKDMVRMDEDEVDALFAAGAPDTIVSYVVAPSNPRKGDICYKILIKADTHELVFFDQHKIRPNAPAGFLPPDLKIISMQRK